MPKLSFLGLCTYGLIKLTFVTLFTYSLVISTEAIAEEEVACAGKDLLAELHQNDPGAYSELRQEASEIVFGDGKLWRVSKPGVRDSWLFGTMHSAEKRVSELPPAAAKAMSGADRVLVEITDNLDPKASQNNLIRLKHMVFRLDGSTTEEDLPEDQIALLKKAVQQRQLPYDLVIRMQPWMLSIMISSQLCDVEAKRQGKALLDAGIARDAQSAGKELVGLETTEEQFKAITSMSEQFQLNALVDVLKIGVHLDDVKETMKVAYVKGDIGIIMPMLRYFSKKFASDNASNEFQQKVVIERNHRMVERALEHFEKGNTFMAVGALHLPGKQGVAKLLEEAGYQVSAIKTH